MSTALTMMNLFTPAAAVASKTLTAPISQVSMLDMIAIANSELALMVYSLCAFRTTTSSPCTPDDYIGIVLFDGRREVVDT
jgi:hypothetical protein